MKKLLNNEGTQYYINNINKASNKKIGDKPLTKVLEDIDSKIIEFENLFSEDFGVAEKVFENNSNTFGSGTGLNSDRNMEIEDSFSDFEIEGRSYINLNLFLESYTENITGWFGSQKTICETYELKLNTPYTFIFDATLTGSLKYSAFELGVGDTVNELIDHPTATKTQIVYSDRNGVNVGVITFTDFKNYKYLTVRCIRRNTTPVQGESVSLNFKSLVVLEGDYTNKPVPRYFKGMGFVGDLGGDGKYNIPIISSEKPFNPTNMKFEFHSDNLTVKLREPLRSLPSGVKDTIEKVNGEWKVVRRIGHRIIEVVSAICDECRTDFNILEN